VSFTNGELTYANTLEHLNILDEDYYFRFMDAMQNQNISDAFLLYDEINRKGFEGDLILNGLAEFIRNLLVSKDPKVAMLLEVSEGFKQRYLDVALKTDAASLLSALNILNEAEINYRQARNKRLHVELTLIKLCYLQQAIELLNDDGQVLKKKQVENMKPVAFKSLAPLALKEKKVTPPTSYDVKLNGKEIHNSENLKYGDKGHNDEAVLVIEKEIIKPSLPRAASDHTLVANVKPQTKLKKLSSLEKIRAQVALDNKQNGNNVKELNEEELYVAWGLYIEELRKNNNHSGVSNFKSSKLNIVDDNCIEIITDNNIQQKFIETERAALIEHLQAHFNNRFLTYRVIIVENKNNNAIPEKHLTTKEQYLKLIEEYPLIKQLKDKLGLQLDY
ncbi:MAG: DNA polymerase III subunit gamma/tau, partial [Ginsengibacter sp.]